MSGGEAEGWEGHGAHDQELWTTGLTDVELGFTLNPAMWSGKPLSFPFLCERQCFDDLFTLRVRTRILQRPPVVWVQNTTEIDKSLSGELT